MEHDIEVAYVGIEVPDPTALTPFFGDVIGLVPGLPGEGGAVIWRNDSHAGRVHVEAGPANDATFLGISTTSGDQSPQYVDRITAAGYEVTPGTDQLKDARKVLDLVHTMAPWGVRLELTSPMAVVGDLWSNPLVPGGFLTEGVGFGHAVFATTAFDESHHFVTEALGLEQSDWVEVELAPGIPLEVRFYHCNERHHSIALAHAPFELPQRLHHLMFEVNDRDDVGRAFDRAWSAGLGIANGLGRHDNDGMFSFYVVSPAGFQVEVGHGARLITDGWDDNRRYDRISSWGHQPLSQG